MFYRSRFSCLSFYLSVFTISHQYNKTFYNPSAICLFKIFIYRYYCLQRQLLCSIIYHLFLTQWKLLPRMHQYACSHIHNNQIHL